MLPMRSPLAALIVAVLMAQLGCRNQTSTLTNPFLTPDRVPPPATRVLAPGTAQPYYPGDPLPGAPVAPAPVIAAPPGTAYPPAPVYPPATTYPATPVYPPAGAYPPVNAQPVTPAYPSNPAPLTTPPGGWGAYQPQSQASPGEAIQTQGDQLPLRFGPPQGDPGAVAFAQSTPTTPTINPASLSLPTPAFSPNAGAQSPLAPASPQQLQAREVTPAEYLAPPQVALAGPTTPTRDGFRPQSGEPREEEPSSQAFRPPEIRRSSVAEAAAATDQYGVAENFQSLRGQLEYWPESGQWSLRYLPAGGPADSLGGRVIVDNPQVLANLQPGEFVAVSGQLYGRPNGDGTAQPAYRVAVVQKQRL